MATPGTPPRRRRVRGRAAGPDRGAYPGSFNPLTRAHLAVAAAARDRHGLGEVHLVVSRVALGKERPDGPVLQHRLEVLERAVSTRPWLRVVVTDAQLIADIADGYGVVIMGADKWAQVNDPAFYPSPAARDEAVRRLPTPAIAPRPPHVAPAEHVLDLPADLAHASSTDARRGRVDLMAPEAAAFDRRTGAWTDPARYRRWLRG